MAARPGSPRSRVAAALTAALAVTVLAACGGPAPVGEPSTTPPDRQPATAGYPSSGSTRAATGAPDSTGAAVTTGAPDSTGTAGTHTASAAGPTPVTDVAVAGTIATGLTTPWGIGFLPDGTALVTERDTAHLLAIDNGPGHAVRTVGTVTGVLPGGEGGLLGLAVPPGAGNPTTVYVYYTAARDNRVARLTLDAAATAITAQHDVLTGIPKAAVHNGGRLAFGPDGALYVGTGDATAPADAQRLDRLGGKILRITVDGKPAPGNPFREAPLVYSYGHRNVQGLAFDARGRLWASEFGASAYDELNLVRPGRNYGWPAVEGPSDDPKYVAPQAYWPTSQASPSGLAIVGDTAFMAALRGARLWVIPLAGPAGPRTPVPRLVDEYGRLRTVLPAPDGSLWLATSNTDGRGDPTPGDDRILRLRIG